MNKRCKHGRYIGPILWGDVQCGRKHPNLPHLRCFREAGHRGPHHSMDWHHEACKLSGRHNMKVSDGGCMGSTAGWR